MLRHSTQKDLQVSKCKCCHTNFPNGWADKKCEYLWPARVTQEVDTNSLELTVNIYLEIIPHICNVSYGNLRHSNTSPGSQTPPGAHRRGNIQCLKTTIYISPCDLRHTLKVDNCREGAYTQRPSRQVFSLVQGSHFQSPIMVMS